MPAARKRNLALVALLTVLLVAATLVFLAYLFDYGQRKAQERSLAGAPAVREETVEVAREPALPEETESEEQAGSAAERPTNSFAREAGLHRTRDPLGLNSSVALMVDRSSGEVLLQKNAQEVLPIASLTKLMTAVVLMESQLPMDEEITITDDDVDRLRNSRSRLRVGSTLTRAEALHLALMSSENRAAHALGRTYPGGVTSLVSAMNVRARALGMKNTTFVDPTGLSNGNISTARDVALLVKAAASKPLIPEFSTTPQLQADLQGGRSLQYLNSNRLVRGSAWDIAVQKTGYIIEAGRCLTLMTEVGGREVIMVLLDADSNAARLRDAERLRRLAAKELDGGTKLAQEPRTETTRPVAAAKPEGPAAVRKVAASRTDGKSPAAKVDGRVRQTFVAGSSS